MHIRTIFHIDMDAFFASIEIIKNPALRGKPVVVGGDPNSRGVVSTCSYEARAFGIHSAMSLAEAQRRCPQAIFLEGDFPSYRQYSHRILEIFKTFTHIVEVVSIDEAYLDVSTIIAQYGTAKALGQRLRRTVYAETQLTCSVGIASNKLVAKVASDLGKPNGLYEVPPGREAEFLKSMPIQKLPGIGKKTQEELNQDGFFTLGDLQLLELDDLMRRYENRGYHYYYAARGRDNRPVEYEEHAPKSIGAETTFEKDVQDRKLLLLALQELTAKVCERLKNNKMRTRSVTLKLRFNDFKTISRSHILFSDTQDYSAILEELLCLFNKVYVEATPIRLIGLSLHKLTDTYWQPTLWEWESSKTKTSLC